MEVFQGQPGFQSERWNECELLRLSLRELQALAKLLGCPCYGTKQTLIIRLLAQRELRFKLARFTDDPDKDSADRGERQGFDSLRTYR